MFLYYLSRFTHYWKKILIVVLLGLSAYSLYEACMFFFVDYPALQEGLATHTLDVDSIQELTANAVAESLVSVINIFFAIRLHKVHEKVMQFIDLVSSSGLVVLHGSVVEWLATFDYVAIWQRFW